MYPATNGEVLYHPRGRYRAPPTPLQPETEKVEYVQLSSGIQKDIQATSMIAYPEENCGSTRRPDHTLLRTG
jgi:hypothetical protein